MQISEITELEYERICPTPKYFYNSAKFHSLNSYKVDEVCFLLFSERKNKLALAGGVKDNVLRIPYSAPYGMFEALQNHIRIEDIDASLIELEKYAIDKGIKEIVFRLPPNVMDCSFIAKVENCLFRQEYRLKDMDVNYHYIIRNSEYYLDALHRNARKNINRALKIPYEFVHCENEAERKRAYEVIKANRHRRGFPLRMTYEQVADTIEHTDNDFFIVRYNDVDVASAVVFKVSEEAYQVIYWGDVEGYELERPMNYLAYKIYNFYCEKNIQILDIGISTEDSIPNLGLCDYKESIGCDICTKNTYSKNVI